MIDDEQGHAFHFRRRLEGDDDLALPMRSEPLEAPLLLCFVPALADGLQHSFVTLGLRVGAFLRFIDDLAGVISGERATDQRDYQNERRDDQTFIHIPMPRQETRALPASLARMRR